MKGTAPATTRVQRVVVGVDGSTPSRAAVRWAAERAERDGLPLRLIHVTVTDGDSGAYPIAESDDSSGAQVLEETAALVATAHPGLELSRGFTSGSLAGALAAAVAPGDLLVIGTHKMGYLHGRVIGSRSVQVAAAVPCDVAVVPDVELRLRRGVVAGIDRASTAAEVARVAAHEAAQLGGELLLVQAVSSDEHIGQNETIATAVNAAREAAPDVVVRGRLMHREPATALLDAARSRALLVLGPGSTEPTRPPIGSVMHDVLLNTSAPVLVTGRPGTQVPAGAAIPHSGAESRLAG